MPMYIDLSTEATVTSIVSADFLNSVKRNIGFDPETPDDMLPVDITELLHECIQICEKEQWRFILRKTVNLSLPYEAFLERDGCFFLPFGRVTAITSFSYTKSDLTTTTVDSSDYTLYSHEPSKLWCEDWTELFEDINDIQPYPITITYTTGYTSFSEVPKSTVRALKILAYHLFEYRDAISDGSVSELPQGYCALRDHNILNDRRAIQYIVDDWSKISRG